MPRKRRVTVDNAESLEEQRRTIATLRTRIAELSRRLVKAEDDLVTSQQVAIDAQAKLDAVREMAANWADGDCPTIQPYGDAILEALKA